MREAEPVDYIYTLYVSIVCMFIYRVSYRELAYVTVGAREASPQSVAAGCQEGKSQRGESTCTPSCCLESNSGHV